MATATVSMPFLNCTAHNPQLDKALSVPEMLSHICNAKTIKEIGKAYGNKVPEEYNIKKIEDLLVSNSDNNTISAKSTPGEIHTFIDKNIHTDFESGKTVIVNGWVLSVTEARQAALLSLIPS